MAIRILICLLSMGLAGCAGEQKIIDGDDRVIRVGDHATLHDLAHVVNEWISVRSAILLGDDRVCVKNNLSLESLVFFDLEPVERLALYNPDYAAKPISEELKIYRLGFLDPCGGRTDYATDPHWILIERKEGFELLNFLQIME